MSSAAIQSSEHDLPCQCLFVSSCFGEVRRPSAFWTTMELYFGVLYFTCAIQTVLITRIIGIPWITALHDDDSDENCIRTTGCRFSCPHPPFLHCPSVVVYGKDAPTSHGLRSCGSFDRRCTYPPGRLEIGDRCGLDSP